MGQRHGNLSSAIGFFVIAVVVAAAQAGPLPSPASTPVDLFTVGDDALSTRLRAAVEREFESASDFHWNRGKEQGTLVVTIPTNVDWEQVGKRTRVRYQAEFSSIEKQSLGTSKGACWEDELEKCASEIIRAARTAARDLR